MSFSADFFFNQQCVEKIEVVRPREGLSFIFFVYILEAGIEYCS